MFKGKNKKITTLLGILTAVGLPAYGLTSLNDLSPYLAILPDVASVVIGIAVYDLLIR